MASCAQCKRTLTKADEAKRVEERQQPDGSVLFFGGDPALPKMSEAKGKMKAVYHFRCYFVMKKAKGMVSWVRYLDTSPTAYVEAADYKNRDDLQAPEVERARLAAERLAELKERKADVELSDEGGAIVGQDLLELDALIEQADADAKLAARQVEIAAEREKEATPESFSDWRDPAQLDI